MPTTQTVQADIGARASLLDAVLRGRATSEDIAVADGGKTLSYSRLDQWSDAIAARLSATVEPGEPVAILLPSSAEFIAAVLGILKTGCLYAPLDPSEPPAVLTRNLRILGTRSMVSSSNHAQLARSIAPEEGLVLVDQENGDTAAPGELSPSDDRACVLFTSGTGGRPVGVIQTGNNLLRNAQYYGQLFDIGPADRIALLASPTFGHSQTIIFNTLVNGAQLHIYDLAHRSILGVGEWIAQREITILYVVPSLFRAIARALPGDRFPSSLRVVRTGGEAANGSDVALFRQVAPPGARLLNALASTETKTLCDGFYESSDISPGMLLPVGRPLPGVDMYVGDAEGRELAEGESGELWVRKGTLSPGYWHDDQATAKRFIQRDGTVLFRTGDLVRCRDGEYELLGRADRQVKIHGVRVNPVRVEAVISGLPEVREAAVIPVGSAGGGTTLAAHVVPEEGMDTIDITDLRRQLLPKLAMPMIPTRLRIWPSLPMTRRGKRDLAALAEASAGEQAPLVMPRDITETTIYEIWCEVLKFDTFGIDDDFFDLGGTSLEAVALLEKLNDKLSEQLDEKVLFDAPTVAKLADVIRRSREIDGLQPDEGVARLRSGDRATPIVFIPGGGANEQTTYFLYGRMLRHLAPGRGVYALLTSAIYSQDAVQSIEQLAERCCQTIKKLQLSEFHLVGGCSGAIVGVEIARRLNAAGAPPRSLILLDSRLRQRYSARRHRYWSMRSKLRIYKRAAKSFRDRIVHHWQNSGGDSPWRRLISLAGKSRSAASFVQQKTQPMTRLAPQAGDARNLARVQNAYITLVAKHLPQPIDGPAYLLVNKLWYDEDPELGWAGIFPDGMTVRTLTGKHEDLVRDNPAAVAKGLDALLLEIESTGGERVSAVAVDGLRA